MNKLKKDRAIFWLLLAIVTGIVGLVMIHGCAQPTAHEKTHKAYIVNSLWQVVNVVETTSAHRAVGDTYWQQVDAYNASTIDDYLRIYYDSVPPIEDSPLVTVYICNPATYAINSSWIDVPRQQLVDNAVGWRLLATGQLFFVDHVPPAPIPTPPPSLYAFYSLYVVDGDGHVQYEDHCGYLPDETFTGQWITDPNQGGWRSIDDYYQTIKRAYQSELVGPGKVGWHLVEHQVYVDPNPPTP